MNAVGRRDRGRPRRAPVLASATVVAFLFCACSGSASPEGQEKRTSPSGSSGKVILEDDFSDPSTGWVPSGRFEGDNSIQEVTDGVLRILIKTPRGRGGPDSIGLTAPNAAELASLADVSIEVTAVRTTDPSGSFYAVLCRLQDFDNFYGFAVLEGGRYSIFKLVNKVAFDLTSGSSDLISDARPARNGVRADCVGDRLVMYVDGQQVAKVHDAQFDSGAMGLLAETRGEAGLEVLFDDLVIRSV